MFFKGPRLPVFFEINYIITMPKKNKKKAIKKKIIGDTAAKPLVLLENFRDEEE